MTYMMTTTRRLDAIMPDSRGLTAIPKDCTRSHLILERRHPPYHMGEEGVVVLQAGTYGRMCPLEPIRLEEILDHCAL